MDSGIIILIILIFINAFFAAAEIAFISINDMRLNKLAKEGNKKAKKIAKMLTNPSEFLATIQIGITLAGFLSSAFASTTFADDLAPFLHDLVPSISLSVWNGIAVFLITIVLSYFTLVFGELVPKRVAMKYSEKISFATINIIRGIKFITSPFVKFLTMSTNAISRLLGVKENDEEPVTEEEIRMMVDVGQEKGVINSVEKEMINNVFEFNDKAVSEIMTHRTNVFAFDETMSIKEVLEKLATDKTHSRIPIYKETIDQVTGILYLKDLLVHKQKETAKISTIVRQALTVPESQIINELFKELQKNKMHMAVVADEYGGTAGIVTMEDILEELVGDIYDEYDNEQNKYQKIDDTTFILSAHISIYELEKILSIDIDDGYADTLSGYLMENIGRIPKVGEQITLNNVLYEIKKVKNKSIIEVVAKKIEVEEDIENEEEGAN